MYGVHEKVISERKGLGDDDYNLVCFWLSLVTIYLLPGRDYTFYLLPEVLEIPQSSQ